MWSKINNFHFYLLFTCLVVLFAPIWIRVNYGQYARNSKLHEPDSYLVTSHAIYLYLQRSVFSHNLLFVDLLIINGSTNMNKSVKFVMFFSLSRIVVLHFVHCFIDVYILCGICFALHATRSACEMYVLQIDIPQENDKLSKEFELQPAEQKMCIMAMVLHI